MRPFCPQCSQQYGSLPFGNDSLVVPPCGHARCYGCVKKKRASICSSDCKEIIRASYSSLAFVILDYIDLSDDGWVEKLISTRNASQFLDNIALEETYSMLEQERSEISLSLQDFSLGSIFQTAVEALVVETSEVEEQEDKILSEIAMETQRLEKLELKIRATKTHMKCRKEAVDGEDIS